MSVRREEGWETGREEGELQGREERDEGGRREDGGYTCALRCAVAAKHVQLVLHLAVLQPGTACCGNTNWCTFVILYTLCRA